MNVGDCLSLLASVISLLSAVLSFIKAKRKEGRYYKIQISRGVINFALSITLLLFTFEVLTMPLAGYIIIALISFLNLNLSYVNYISLLKG